MTTLIVPAALDTTIPNVLATLTGKQNLSNKTLKTTKETVTVTGIAAGGAMNFDVATQSISVYNTASANFSLTIRADATNNLGSVLNVGESIGICLIVPNGTTAYYLTGITIDGSGRTIKWLGGVPVVSGNVSATDIYNIAIIKTASTTYQVYASQSKFA
jgi:hypothetical protein